MFYCINFQIKFRYSDPDENRFFYYLIGSYINHVYLHQNKHMGTNMYMKYLVSNFC